TRCDMSTSTDDYFQRLRDLLDLESEAEVRQTLERIRRLPAPEAERAGVCLTNLVVVDEQGGLGGRFILTLARRARTPLPWSRLGVGTPVVLSPGTGKPDDGRRGIVCERNESSIRVAFDELPEDEADTWRLDLAHDEIARLRQR